MSFPWRAVHRPLGAADRRRLAGHLRALVEWQRRLRAWPRPVRAPDADPFVSLYAGGTLRGCFGSAEGAPGERVARAFLLAAGDTRFPAIGAAERAQVVAQISYCVDPRERTAAELAERLEIGADGIAVLLPDGRRTAVLPDVARDRALAAPAFIAAARAKLGLRADDHPRGARYFTFRTQTVTSREGGAAPAGDGVALAAGWLLRRVGRDGSITVGVDGRGARALARGPMFHARAAVVIEALHGRGARAAPVTAARGWLGRELARALRGARVDGWPESPALIAGTLAHAARAGADVTAPLLAMARDWRALAASPWQAAQVVAATGASAPAPLWRACVRDLDRDPVAPWTLLAARRLGDHGVVARCEGALIDAVRDRGPHRGAVHGAAVPELALTSIAVTALRPSRSPAARRAIARAVEFLASWQLTPRAMPAALDPAWSLGAFPLSPVHDVLRADVTAHALLALAGE